MRRWWLACSLVLALLPQLAWGAVVFSERDWQVLKALARNGSPSSLVVGTTLPGTCTTGQLFFDSDEVPSGLFYACVATDSWLLLDNGLIPTLENVFLSGNVINTALPLTPLKVGTTTDYWIMDYDPTSGLRLLGVCGGVINGCDYVTSLSAGFYWGIKNAAGTHILRVTNDTGRLTHATVREEKFWPVATVQNGVATILFNLPASNPPTAGAIVGTNVITGAADFNDTTANSFQDEWVLPPGFTGSIDVSFRWVSASTTGSVAWCAQLIRIGVSGSIDPAFPAVSTSNCVSDAANGSANTENLATISGVTCTSCVAGDRVAVRVSRDPAEVSTRTDNMTGNARLIEYGRTWDRVLQ